MIDPACRFASCRLNPSIRFPDRLPGWDHGQKHASALLSDGVGTRNLERTTHRFAHKMSRVREEGAL